MAPDGQTYVLNQKLLSIGGDLWIEDDTGDRVFEVDGKAFSLRRSLELRDPAGETLYTIGQSLAHLHRTFEIKRGGDLVATIEEALFNVIGDHFTVRLVAGDELAVKGDWIDREFHVIRAGSGDSEVIVASRRLISLRDSYGVQVASGFDAALAVAIVVALEQMELEGRRDR
ncbi:MAG: LURP-one-related family protein [Chloroflexi bacterium]|nr:LURP-one-related family protein [Chloroflexota bacterium]